MNDDHIYVDQAMFVVNTKQEKSRLNIIPNGGLVIHSVEPAPNIFRRFWYWFLLGWTWETLDSSDNN